MAVSILTMPQMEYAIDAIARYTIFSDVKAALVAQDVDGDWLDTQETWLSWAGYRRRAFVDLEGSTSSTEKWAAVAQAQITPAPSGALPATFDTAGGEEILIFGSMFAPGCTATMGGEPITIIAQTGGTILGLTPALAAAAANDIVVTSPADNAGTLSPGPATAAKDPTFVSITPDTGPAAGGSEHVLVGTNFVPGLAVTIGGHAAGVVWLNDTHLRVTPAAHAAGALDIVITNANTETVTAASGFTYV